MKCTTCSHDRHNHVTGGWPHYRTPCDLCLNCQRGKPLGKDCCTRPNRCKCLSFTAPEPTDRYTQDREAGAIGGTP